MTIPKVFVLQVVLSLGAYSALAWAVLVPRIAHATRRDALAMVIWPETLRHVGATMLAVGGGDTVLEAWSEPLAVGDCATAMLALVTFVALKRRWRVAVPMAWVTTLFGGADLLHNVVQAARLGVAPRLGLATLVPTMGVPLMFVLHVVALGILARRLPTLERAAEP
jgi:hypothetical protein